MFSVGIFSTRPFAPNHEEVANPIPALPKDVILSIFSYLDVKELARCCLVSKQWSQLASDPNLWDLKRFFPSLKIFDETFWQKSVNLPFYVLTVEDAPSLNNRIRIPLLDKLVALSIEDNAGLTLLTIPRGLTLNKLIRIASLHKSESAASFREIWFGIAENFGDIEVDKTYRIAITNSILAGSRNLSIAALKNLVANLELGCEMPKLLEIATLLFLSYMSSHERLYSDSPSTYTYCSEEVNGRLMVLGNFAPTGVSVHINIYVNSGNFGREDYGVGVVLRDL